MKKGKNSPERLLEEIMQLDPVQFLGVCKILNIPVYEEEKEEEDDESGRAEKPRDFYELWSDVCDALDTMNRVRRRNLGQILHAATKKEKDK